MAPDAGNDEIILLLSAREHTSQMSRKFPVGSPLKPKPILRIGIGEHAAPRLEIFKT
jgi:hypothetical protein